VTCDPLAGRWSRERRIGELHGEVPPGPRPSERVLPAGLFVDRVGSTGLVIGAGGGGGRRGLGAVAERLGVRVRAGVHAGECEVADGAARGDAVHIGARIAAFADPGEVLVSPIAKDLVVGSGLRFEPRGTCPLQGAPGLWPLFAPT